MKIKAGYRTTEFWFTLVSFIFSGLYLTGILTENEHKEELITIVSHAVESVILISGQIWILARYIRGRTEVKKIAESEIKTEESIDDTKRTNNKRSRKSTSATKRKTTKSKKSSTK